MADSLALSDFAVHSDFLIHWTGKDIDEEYQPDWNRVDPRSRMPEHVRGLYVKRLHDILAYGFWMTAESEKSFSVGSSVITIPATPQCCFTELKLSESRRHAARYGRLGIGVKRPFLFQRYGRPLAYFGFGEGSTNDRFLEACMADFSDKKLLNFFKPMNANTRQLNYDLYSESEWRILFFEELLRTHKIVDPAQTSDGYEHAYYQTLSSAQRKKLRYLIPLDGWFAMIIYPSLDVKNAAQWESKHGVLKEIERIKRADGDHGNLVEGIKYPMRGNWPIEVDLNACRHF